MFVRLLLNPNATDGGAGDATPQTAAATTQATQQAAPAQAQAATPQTVTLPADEYQRLYGAAAQLSAMQAEQDRIQREAQQQAALAQAQRGEIQQALDALRQQSTEREQALTRRLHDREMSLAVAGSLAGVTFANPFAAQQAQQLLASGLQVVDVNGSLEVRHAQTGLRASDFIAQQLKTPAFAHFLAPTTQGGTGNANADRTPQDGQQQAQKPTNLSMAMLDWIANQKRDEPQMAGINIHRMPQANGRN